MYSPIASQKAISDLSIPYCRVLILVELYKTQLSLLNIHIHSCRYIHKVRLIGEMPNE